jgi:hypothetical protein
VHWGVYALLTAFGLGYLVTVAPDIYFRDAGELVASAHTLGVAHPTGFSLYLMFAKLASFIPFGTVAFRINLLSVVCGVVALALLVKTLRQCTGDRAAAYVMTALFGGTSIFWLHSTTSEVYVPNLLGLILLLQLLVAGLNGSQRAFRTAGVISGLGAGLHAASFAIIGGGMWIWTLAILASRQGAKKTRQVVSWAIPLTAMGCLTLLYLPIRAAAAPYCNWGDPSTGVRMLDHLTGARIRESFATQMGSNTALDIWIERSILQIVDQFSWATGFFIFGLIALCVKRNAMLGVLLVGGLADILFTLYLNPMGMDDRQTGLFTLMATAATSALGVSFVRQHIISKGGRFGAPWLTGLLVVGLASPAVIDPGYSRDLRHLYHAAQLGHEAFEQALPRSLILVTSDDMASSLTYLQAAENRRPDVTVVVKQHLSDPISLKHAQRRGGASHVSDALIARATAGAGPTEMLQQILAENTHYPVLYEPGDSRLDGLVSDKVRLDLPLARLYGEPTRNLMSQIYYYRMRWRAIAGAAWPTIALYTLSRRYSGLGLWLWEFGDRRFGLSLVREACALAPYEPVVRNNCGSLEMRVEDHDVAIKQFTAAVRARSTYALGWFNLGVSQYHRGSRQEAADAFATAARLGVSKARLGRALLYLSVMAANDGSYSEAYSLLGLGQSVMPPAEHQQASLIRSQLETVLLSGSTDDTTQSK